MAAQINASTSDGKEGADGGAHRKTIVHFSSREPDQISGSVISSELNPAGDSDVSAQQQRQQLDKLTDSLSASLQQQRLTHPDFQPFSLPPSRAPSRVNSNTSDSPRKNMNSPPLTPASTQDRPPFRQSRTDDYRSTLQPPRHPGADPNTMTPQTSPPRLGAGTLTPRYPISSANSPTSSRPVSAHSVQGRTPTFTIGPADFTVSSPSEFGDSPAAPHRLRFPFGSDHAYPSLFPFATFHTGTGPRRPLCATQETASVQEGGRY